MEGRPKGRKRELVSSVAALLACGVLAGAVTASAAFPAAAFTALAAKAGGESLGELPSQLREFTSPQVSRIYASDNRTQIAIFYDEFRGDVALKDTSKHMRDAMVAAEDRQFDQHNGVDVKGVARALVSNSSGSNSKQGASTITMQYVRMSLAYSATNPRDVVAATEDSPQRKIAEMRYALQLEKELTKDQILERYLNIVPFGNQTYGVYAARQGADPTAGQAGRQGLYLGGEEQLGLLL
jgi:membrane peptidoglycan carboxypeptidase